ncbi:MAG: VWA domain-containing protein [Acidobacteria bacterium]|nr:VWA domain-containing protein [Acidobacteriota bacterium]
MFRLEFPWVLAALPLPLLVWWLLPPYREESPSVRMAFFRDVAEAAGLRPQGGSVILRTNWLQRVLAPLCWLLLVVAAARPQYVEPPLQKVQPARDLLLALDLSQSMDTRDFHDPQGQLVTRVEAVREVVDGFVKRRKGDRIGLVVFGDAPYPLASFTLDHQTVQTLVEQTIPGMAGPRTALGDCIGLGIKMFKASRAPDKVMILLTDGSDTASRMPPDRAAGIAKDRGIRIDTVGIGAPQATGEAKVDTATLRKIAETTGGRYFFGQDQNALAEIYATIDEITPANFQTLSWRPKRELFHYPLGAAVLAVLAYHLVMFFVASIRRIRRRARAPEAAS